MKLGEIQPLPPLKIRTLYWVAVEIPVALYTTVSVFGIAVQVVPFVEYSHCNDPGVYPYPGDNDNTEVSLAQIVARLPVTENDAGTAVIFAVSLAG
ncbi:hypothetical protein D3C86_1427590 [compost metagenome]